MTCVVAIKGDDGIYIGSDTLASSTESGAARVRSKNSKVFKIGEFTIGFSGSYAIAQAVQFGFKPPSLPKKLESVESFMVGKFIDKFSNFIYNKFDINKIEKEFDDSSFIVVFKNNIFLIEQDFHIEIVNHDYEAIGGASDIAIGALYSAKEIESKYKIKIHPRDMIKIALDAAKEFNMTVRDPYEIIKA